MRPPSALRYAALLLLALGVSGGAKEEASTGTAGGRDLRFQAALWWHRDEAPFCGAAVVDERNLVTAAHCIFEGSTKPVRRPTNFLWVTAGSDNYEHAARYEVSYTYVHHLYDPTTSNNDVAVVKLKQPLRMGAAVRSIQLATSAPSPGSRCQLSGWGAWANWGDTNSSALQLMDVSVQSDDACATVQGLEIPEDVFICVTPGEGRAYSHADSGGPLTCAGRLAAVALRSDRRGGALVLSDVTRHSSFVQASVAHVGRESWPLSSSILVGFAEAFVGIVVTAAMVRVHESR